MSATSSSSSPPRHSAGMAAAAAAVGLAEGVEVVRGRELFTPVFWARVLFLVVLTVGLRSVDGASHHGISPPSENCFARNLYSSLMFKCKRPQPRAFRSSEVIGELFAEGEYIKPCMAVLHRCDSSSGCCMHKEGMSCAPKETKLVRLDFKIRPKFSRGERLVSVLARNHTVCECVEEELIREEKIAERAFVFSSADFESPLSQVRVY